MTDPAATPAADDQGSAGRLNRRSLLAGLAALTSGCGRQTDKETVRTTEPTTDPPSRTPSEVVGDTPTATPQEPIILAGTLPLSGSLSAIGVPLREGLSVWARQVNDASGLSGRPIALRIEDDGGDPGTAREAYRSLVNEADLLVTPYGSRLTKAVLDVVESAGLPCVAHTAGDRALWADGREWTVQLLNPVDTFLHSLLAVAAREGAESVAFCYHEDAFMQTVMGGAVERAHQRGWTVTDEVTYTSTDGLESKLQAAIETGPDLLVGGGFRPGAAGGGFLPDALALSRAYQQVSGAALVNWAIGASFPAFRERRGASADLETGVTGWKPYLDYPDNASFLDRYREQVGEPPDSHAAQGYATGQVLASAVERAGDLTPAAVRDALFALRTTTVFGRYRVSERGLQVGKANAVVQWQDGSPTVIWPERWQDGKPVYPANEEGSVRVPR